MTVTPRELCPDAEMSIRTHSTEASRSMKVRRRSRGRVCEAPPEALELRERDCDIKGTR